VTAADWIAIGFVVLVAALGRRRGLIASTLSFAGIAIGAALGARLAPELLHGGSKSPYTPLAALAGAAVLAVVLEVSGAMVGQMLRSGLRLPALRTLDSIGGLILGALAALAVVWVVGVVALQVPGRPALRRSAQHSELLRQLNSIVPPAQMLHALERVDPFPAIAGPSGPTKAPSPQVLRLPGVRNAYRSVVRVTGTACGLSVEGSGWVARPEEVVTAAHVVAGETDTQVQAPGGPALQATPVAFDPKNDVAVLAVKGLNAPALPSVAPQEDAPVAIIGYPENGPLTAVPGRIGRTAAVLTQDAYGNRLVLRTITGLGGDVRHGNSGGPAVDASGRVESTVFAARTGSSGGYGVPDGPVRSALVSARGAVSTGNC
jgi:uncharacterized membrane protein required for colicin V production